MGTRANTAASRLLLLVALMALAAVGVGIGRSLIKRAEVKREVAKLQEDIAQFDDKSKELNQLLQYLGTDEYQEREARLRLGLMKPGEQVVVIPGLTSEGGAATPAGGQSDPNWQRWVKVFFPN